MKQVKAIGRHRKVTGVPHKSNRLIVAPTGIMFRGCAVALLVPQISPVSPDKLAASYARSTNELVKKAKELSVRDMYLMQTQAADKLQEQLDG